MNFTSEIICDRTDSNPRSLKDQGEKMRLKDCMQSSQDCISPEEVFLVRRGGASFSNFISGNNFWDTLLCQGPQRT
jgi:hypothetical protein